MSFLSHDARCIGIYLCDAEYAPAGQKPKASIERRSFVPSSTRSCSLRYLLQALADRFDMKSKKAN